MKLSQYQRAAQILLYLAIPVASHDTNGRPGHGLIGYGISMYKPVCAYACRASITNPLNCGTAVEHEIDTDMSRTTMNTPSPSCYANNDPFLQTLAYCMHTHCTDVSVSVLEHYWELNVAGRQQHQPSPKESYQEALESLARPPTIILNTSAVLDIASLVEEETYLSNYNTLWAFEAVETSHERYGTWFASTHDEILTYVANRIGVLSFANIPLLVLYTGRNNFLLWLTDWSHSTFLLLHRWLAFICTLETCLHSAIYLQIAVANSEHSTESKQPFWIWGVVATLAMAIMIPSSTWPIRKRCYELFLAWHIVLSFLALLACYWHIWYRYGHQWGYETWIYVAFGIWAFERVFRVLRLARNGIQKAHVTVLDDEYIKVEVPGVHAQGHVYLYFPTLTWRVWENHPFSAIASFRRDSMERKIDVVSQDVKNEYLSKNSASVTTFLDADKPPSTSSAQDLATGPYQPCLTFFVRTLSGTTRQLRARAQLPVLVEGSYPPSPLISHHWSSHPNVIAIAGGVGITALVPDLCSHRGGHTLFWASRSKALIESARETVGDALWHDMNVRIYHDQRMDIPTLLTEEVQKYQGAPVCVVVSGPARMADEVRHVVSEMVRQNPALLVSFVEESFTW
ncbi:putative ferric-chelate reductase (Fre2) [Aspergillus fischeri NRRL 181]|uniref:Rerric reductase like transmembrane component, putative n=1 Tax=Neosartorya fischeri (strain ATCC 1020 / DSM 3700 / CBS 544.65 / FGSC A1164 / JCM 1740 / NRRL 181 / WB 181) TaxID=331117 RepID=A1DAG8_NEOFI|nr:rerric reductase like transmembrane component, putative [Aspergillus fischeri NRRL 181]EAW19858.1 rerric reductase like transmembrane component, putative [Aspergillus fischeri NRRL 181]